MSIATTSSECHINSPKSIVVSARTTTISISTSHSATDEQPATDVTSVITTVVTSADVCDPGYDSYVYSIFTYRNVVGTNVIDVTMEDTTVQPFYIVPNDRTEEETGMRHIRLTARGPLRETFTVAINEYPDNPHTPVSGSIADAITGKWVDIHQGHPDDDTYGLEYTYVAPDCKEYPLHQDVAQTTAPQYYSGSVPQQKMEYSPSMSGYAIMGIPMVEGAAVRDVVGKLARVPLYKHPDHGSAMALRESRSVMRVPLYKHPDCGSSTEL